MGDYKRDSEQDNSMDCPIWGTDDISDEELLKELEAVKNMAVPLPIPSPSPDEFEKIWARIQEERAESKNVPDSDQPEHPKVIKPRFGWKRLAAIGLIACLVAGSGCMVAMGTKSYFYRERVRDEKNIIYNNDSNKIAVNGEEEAYNIIQQEPDIKPLKMGYIPTDMIFLDLSIEEGYASLRFEYDDEFVYFVQSKFDKSVSFNCNSDTKYNHIVHNKWIDQDLNVSRELISEGRYRYECSFIIDGISYCVAGVSSEKEFIKTIERLTY